MKIFVWAWHIGWGKQKGCTYSSGVGIAQWLEHRTHDWKVMCLNPCRSGRRIFFSRVDFLCWLLFRYPFQPRVTAVARKRSRSFCQKCRWQVTAKHAYTLHMWLCMKWLVVWCTQNLRRDGCSFMWYQPCQHCKYTFQWIFKQHTIKSQSLMWNHMQAQWVCSREWRIALYEWSSIKHECIK